MKRFHIMRLLVILMLIVFGFTNRAFAQEVRLPEVKVVAVNYKYLNSVGSDDVAQPVRLLEREAAAYDIRNSEYYEDDYGTYFVSFIIPDGKILAAYDKDGKLIRTAEKFKNTALPKAVRESVVQKYPGWSVAKDVYKVDYHDTKGVSKRYKITLENGDKRMKVKMNENGEVLKS